MKALPITGPFQHSPTVKPKFPSWSGLIVMLLSVTVSGVTVATVISRDRNRLSEWDRAHAEVRGYMRETVRAIVEDGQVDAQRPDEADDEYANRIQSFAKLCRELDVAPPAAVHPGACSQKT